MEIFLDAYLLFGNEYEDSLVAYCSCRSTSELNLEAGLSKIWSRSSPVLPDHWIYMQMSVFHESQFLHVYDHCTISIHRTILTRIETIKMIFKQIAETANRLEHFFVMDTLQIKLTQY
jgi:hypothetical protein